MKTDETTVDEQTQTSTVVTKYYLRSTVMGGQVVTEMDEDGAKLRTFVYGGGSVLAWQVVQGSVQRVVWEHRDASGATFKTTDVSGSTTGQAPDEERAELDPTGANAGWHAPLVVPDPPPDEGGSLMPYPRFSDPRRPGVTYAVDGIPVTVDYFMAHLDFAFQGSIGLVHAAARASNRVVGRENSGVSWGRPFKHVSGPNGRPVTTQWGEYNPELAGVNYGVETPIYESSWSAFGLLLGTRQNTLTIEHFTPAQESWIRYEMKFLLSKKCGDAYEAERLHSPESIISGRGVVIRHAKDLGERSAADLGLDPRTYRDAQTKINSGQGGTVFGIDGTLQIYLNSYAFVGPNLDGGYLSLAEVLKHEFIHEGIREWPSPWHPFSHDLRGFPGYYRIMEGCK